MLVIHFYLKQISNILKRNSLVATLAVIRMIFESVKPPSYLTKGIQLS
jgi:hypothetical protein